MTSVVTNIGSLADDADVLCNKDGRPVGRYWTCRKAFSWFSDHGSWHFIWRVWL